MEQGRKMATFCSRKIRLSLCGVPMNSEKLQQLERTILDLGSELYRLKSEISTVKGYHENFVDIVDGLKKILDEKGLISLEDFESAVELGQAVNITTNQIDYSIETELERVKKTSH
jgi:hypothetical protein